MISLNSNKMFLKTQNEVINKKIFLWVKLETHGKLIIYPNILNHIFNTSFLNKHIKAFQSFNVLLKIRAVIMNLI